jgi:dihydroorotase
MPNTSPPIDTKASVQFIYHKTSADGVVNVLPVGTVTQARKGEEIAEIGDLVQAGVVAISDDGSPIMSAEVMRRALEYTKMFGIPLLDHAEDHTLSEKGFIHEGEVSTILGLRGIPAEAETVMVSRDIQLARLTNGRLHICHVSAAESVSLIRAAKKVGIRVTAEVTPHHLALTDEACSEFDSNTKMNPPLRSKEHQDALWKGLRDGTIDVIATDHAPHSEIEKDYPFIDAPYGVTGLETAVPVLFTAAMKRRGWSFESLLPKLTTGPAAVLGIDKGTLKPGSDADVTLIDPDLEGVFEKKSDFVSKSWNSPFLGMKLRGFPVTTIVGGKVVMNERKLLSRGM